MLKYSFKTIGLLAMILTMFLWLGLVGPQDVRAASYDFDTDSFNVDVTVEEDNSLEITETISVDFHRAKHGIFRYIPLEGTAYYKVGGEDVEQSRNMKIDQVKVNGYEYDTYKENGNLVIRVGDEDVTVTGKQTYKISYRCRLYDDKIDAYDMLYYNVLPQGNSGGGWETSIQEARVRIHMPKEFDEDNLHVYAGYYGSDAFSDLLKIKVQGCDIEIKAARALPQGVGITAQAILPEGYFKNEMTTDWAYSALLLIMIFCGLLAVILWLRFGKDAKMVRTVEFYPPDGLTSADMGYIVDGYVDKADMVSMIIYFAEQGYITIEEQELGQFLLHKEQDLPEDANDFEHTLMDGLFQCGDGTSVALSDLREAFYDSYQTAAGQLKKKYKKKKHRIFYKSGSVARIIAAVLMVIPVGAGVVFSSLFAQEGAFAIAAAPLSAVMLILYLIGMYVYDKKDSMKRGGYRAGNAILLILEAAVLCGAAGLIDYLAGTAAGAMTVISSIIAYICARQMRKRTPYGTKITGKILGFRHFIETAELERLEALVNEDPSYFYHILPYAYVFGLSDKWAKNFESIAVEPPNWYGGHYGQSAFNTWVFMNAFHSCSYAMGQNISVPSASEGGSGGISGGGFSGGGFSGGGFGGGGGGSW
ncbi:MAG: DUF2207 domain-containing protein [Firmicutes bacterium]|jgi:uncharacterized membrane protein|nr:DUF2207 domain-containing protein [Bacillota bacterium]NBI64669.1 DUF2207 domain-containing protein [Clostridiales bacterium]